MDSRFRQPDTQMPTRVHPKLAPPRRNFTFPGLNANASRRLARRRASKACYLCHQRKVRCNLVQQGAPCTNCKMDDVDCVVAKRKQQREHIHETGQHETVNERVNPVARISPVDYGPGNAPGMDNLVFRRQGSSGNCITGTTDRTQGQHVPCQPYQCTSQFLGQETNDFSRGRSASMVTSRLRLDTQKLLLPNSPSMCGELMSTGIQPTTRPIPQKSAPNSTLPLYIKSPPSRLTQGDTEYLRKKGALSIPNTAFRNELLLSYVEFVHPYMPMMDIQQLLHIVEENSGESGKISLLLFQAVMFAGISFIDMRCLSLAGFPNRRAARKEFFLKARALYDFNYEADGVAVVQALLLMTCWYESPHDHKDTWHWMGVAISVSTTIGLHRNAAESNIPLKKQKLWKRIWWSCLMRDRLIALGMRTPARIKDEDHDVPMLTEDDFDTEPLEITPTSIIPQCSLIADQEKLKAMAIMCVANAKLCVCISHVISAKYSISAKETVYSSVSLDETDEVKKCDEELLDWVEELPDSCRYTNPTINDIQIYGSSIVVQLAMLHMVYFTTLSALHRSQFPPPISSTKAVHSCEDQSRMKAREASHQVTRMCQELHNLALERYLPPTGVTVIIPAVIFHLLDIKDCHDRTRDIAIRGFSTCMRVLETLRGNYSAAEYAAKFLEVAFLKADLYGEISNPEKDVATVQPDQDFQNGRASVKNAEQSVGGVNNGYRVTPIPDFSNVTINQTQVPCQPNIWTEMSPESAGSMHVDKEFEKDIFGNPTSMDFDANLAFDNIFDFDQYLQMDGVFCGIGR